MNREQLIRIAREAGIPVEVDWAGRTGVWSILRGVDDLERFARLVATEIGRAHV